MVDMLKKAEIASINRIDFNSAFTNFINGNKEFNLERVFIKDARKSLSDVAKFNNLKKSIDDGMLSSEFDNLNFLLNPTVKEMVDDVFIAKLLTSSFYNELRHIMNPTLFYDFRITNPKIINHITDLLNSDLNRNKDLLDYLFLFRSQELDVNRFKELVTKVAAYRATPINKLEFYKFMVENFPNVFTKLNKLLVIGLSEIEVTDERKDKLQMFNEMFPYVKHIIQNDVDMAALYTDVLTNIKDKNCYLRTIGILSKILTKLFDGVDVGQDLFILSYSTNKELVHNIIKRYLDNILDKAEYKDAKEIWSNSLITYNAILQTQEISQEAVSSYRSLTVFYCDSVVNVFELDNVDAKYNYEFSVFVQRIYDHCIKAVNLDLQVPFDHNITVEEKIEKFSQLVGRIEDLYLERPKDSYVNEEKKKFNRASNQLKGLLSTPLRLFASDSDKLSKFKKMFEQIEKEKQQDDVKQNFESQFDKLFVDANQAQDVEQAKKYYFDFLSMTEDFSLREEKLFYQILKQCTEMNTEVSQKLIDYIFLNETEHSDDVLTVQHDMLGAVRSFDYNKYNINSVFSGKVAAHVYSGILKDFGDRLSDTHLKVLMAHYVRFSAGKEDFNQLILHQLSKRKLFVTLVDFYYLMRKTDKYTEMFAVDFINTLKKRNDTVIYVDTVFYDYIHVKKHVLPIDYLFEALEAILKFNQKLFLTEVDTIEEYMAYTSKNQKLDLEIENKLRMQFYVGLFKIAVNNKLVKLADEAFDRVENKNMLFFDDNWLLLLHYLNINPGRHAAILELFVLNKESSEFLNKESADVLTEVLTLLEPNIEIIGNKVTDWLLIFLDVYVSRMILNDKSLGIILRILSKIKNERSLVICLKRVLRITQNMVLNKKTQTYFKNLASGIRHQQIREDVLKLVESQITGKKDTPKATEETELENNEEEPEKVGDYYFLLHMKMVMYGIISSRFEYKPEQFHYYKEGREHKPVRPPKDKRAYFYQLLDPAFEEDEQRMNEMTLEAKDNLKKQQEENQIEHFYQNATWMDEVIRNNYESVHEIAAMSREKAEQTYGRIGVVPEEDDDESDESEHVSDKIKTKVA